MESKRVLGPSLAFKLIAGLMLVAAMWWLWADSGPPSLAFAALAVVGIWRLLSVSVSFDGRDMVTRNVRETIRFSVDEVDIRARVVDPRQEMYSSGNPEGFPDIPTASDDNTSQAAKWYELIHGKDRYSIDALIARSPANHEHLAWELRRQLVAVRGIAPGEG